MLMTIVDEDYATTSGKEGFAQVIETQCIPRIGENLLWNSKITTVKTVTYDFLKNEVVVIIK